MGVWMYPSTPEPGSLAHDVMQLSARLDTVEAKLERWKLWRELRVPVTLMAFATSLTVGPFIALVFWWVRW